MSNPSFYESCGRCPECPNTHRLVHGDGPTPCSIMAIGEAPGAEEDAGGRPFTGRSGKELNDNYLPRMGFNRSGIYFTNSVKCRPDGKNSTPSDKLRISCANHFIAKEIEMVKPEFILLLGATALKLVAKPLKLERHHGHPMLLKEGEGGLLGNYTKYICPFYHPAAGMHNTAMMIPLLKDSDNILRWQRDLWTPPTDQYPEREYELIEDINTLTRKFNMGMETAIDTETDSHQKFWSTQFSQCPGTGYAIMARDEYLTLQLVEALTENSLRGGTFIAQNTLVDYMPLHQRGMFINPFNIRDTMQQAFQHGNTPQGLKSMSVRLVGVEMRDFESVVLPPSLKLLTSWIDNLRLVDSTFTSPKMSIINGILHAIPQPGPLSKKIDALVKKVVKAYETGETKVFKAAAEFYEKYEIEKYRLPLPPLMGIEHVPFLDALDYMCQDPDITIRCYFELILMAAYDMQRRYNVPVDSWRNLNLTGGSIVSLDEVTKTTGPVVPATSIVIPQSISQLIQ